MSISALLVELEERLPELEWKINTLGNSFSFKSLPRGLFRPRFEVTPSACVAEIKADMRALALQKSEYSAHYLAQRIHQKINVLVTLCHLRANKQKKNEKINFGVTSISTRQQWLQSLQKDINLLTEQQLAMTKTLEQMQSRGNPQALLNLQAELGEIEKRLTLAKETFARTTNLD